MLENMLEDYSKIVNKYNFIKRGVIVLKENYYLVLPKRI